MSYKPSIKIENIQNSICLIRIDANLPSLSDTFRLKAIRKTVELLVKNSNKIIFITHWGRPEGKENLEYSTNLLIPVMEEIFENQVCWLNQFKSFADVQDAVVESGENMFLLENSRFNPDEDCEDEEKKSILAGKYASIGQCFIDEAFAVSHRNEATNSNIKSFLPWCFGLRYEEEISTLTKFKNNPDNPSVVILGGAKPETKLALIEKLLPQNDFFLVGGLLAFTFLQAAFEMNMIKENLVQDTPISASFLPDAKRLLSQYKEKIILPVDAVFENVDGKNYGRDVGVLTVQNFREILQKANTIFWNGPLGMSQPPFDASTKEIVQILSESKANTIIGGGDTAAMIPENMLDSFNFVSTGGGATLDFLAE